MKMESGLKHSSPQGMQISDSKQERESKMRDMYELMDLWGAWAASDNSGVDWQPIAAGFKGLLPHGKKSRNQCDDDTGVMIDGFVAQLKAYHYAEYVLIIAHFIFGISLRCIAKKLKCSDGTIRKKMSWALGFFFWMF